MITINDYVCFIVYGLFPTKLVCVGLVLFNSIFGTDGWLIIFVNVDPV